MAQKAAPKFLGHIPLTHNNVGKQFSVNSESPKSSQPSDDYAVYHSALIEALPRKSSSSPPNLSTPFMEFI